MSTRSTLGGYVPEDSKQAGTLLQSWLQGTKSRALKHDGVLGGAMMSDCNDAQVHSKKHSSNKGFALDERGCFRRRATTSSSGWFVSVAVRLKGI